MTAEVFETGQTISVTASFVDGMGDLVDPAAVSVTITKPDGTTLTPPPNITTIGVGRRLITFTLSERGTWGVRWTSVDPTSAVDQMFVADWASTYSGGQSLVTLQEYRDITRDHVTENGEVQAYLTEAVSLLEEHLQRKLTNQQVTEVLEVWCIDDVTYAYPTITPITAIPPNTTYVIDHNNARLRGVTLLSESIVSGVGLELLGDGNPYVLRERPRYTEVTYSGGYTNATLPQTLKRALCRIAFGLSRMSTSSVIGAESMRVGDVSVSYPKSQGALDALAPGTSLMVKPYKRKRLRF